MAELSSSPPASEFTSPEQRPSSPSPSVSPAPALDAVPRLDRSVSTPASSTISTSSSRSRQSRTSDGGATLVRRRGYMRPQGTAFADSARNRDSVMSLGSIAHMQYYFARTGLLDGKGAQLAKGKDRKASMNDKENIGPPTPGLDDYGITSLSLHDTSSAYAVSESGLDCSVVESPSETLEMSDFSWNVPQPMMLPPTVSTYKQRASYNEPLPGLPVLRRELKEALQDACKVLEETQKSTSCDGPDGENDGFYEIQGLHLLDIITLAIRAAKNYYTSQSNPQKLYAIRSEKLIRSDLYQVLDVLKRMASRNFRGGLRVLELADILMWIETIDKLLRNEDELEQQEATEREAMIWREGDWTGREREREWLFLKSFDAETPPLPQWPEQSDDQETPSEFLRILQDGQRLVKLHNAFVTRSRRRFGAIKTWHTDVLKPYRMAENMRYWLKASELSWDTKLSLPVLDVVSGKNDDGWRMFDEAIFKWSRGVRTELMEEWRLEAQSGRRKPPELKVELPEGNCETEAEVSW